jgi:hypothetical protein
MRSLLMNHTAIAPGKRYKVNLPGGAPVSEGLSPSSPTLHHLPQDTIVVCAEVMLLDEHEERLRISSPAGWMSSAALEPAEPCPSLKIDFETLEKRHLEIAPGDHYGLKFPFTLAQILEFGPDFLTAAFRAAGTISKHNRVTEIVALEPLTVQGASENGLLTVAYAQDEPGLEAELFVKCPSNILGYKYYLVGESQGEVEIQRLGNREDFPTHTAKYYYGDYCSYTANFLLITERIRFGVGPIEPAYRKGHDQNVPDAMDHYLVLTKALAGLVAAHKTGAMGIEIERTFPFPRAARNFDTMENPEVRLDQLIDFIANTAPQLFVAGATDPGFLRKWREDVLFGLQHKDSVIAYLHADVDYTGLCHPNLNLDNAWFWRDSSDQLQAGLLDWGSTGQMSIAQALSGMLMMPDSDMYLALVREVIATFTVHYARMGGRQLDPEELSRQYKASLFSVAIYMILTIVVDALGRLSDDEYKSMENRFDKKLQESGLNGAIIWIDNILREWMEDYTPGDACRDIVDRAQRLS